MPLILLRLIITKLRPGWPAPTTGGFFEKPFNNNQCAFMLMGAVAKELLSGYTRTDDKGILPNSSIVKSLVH